MLNNLRQFFFFFSRFTCSGQSVHCERSPLLLAFSDKHIQYVMKPCDHDTLTNSWHVFEWNKTDIQTQKQVGGGGGETKQSSHDPNKTTHKCTRNYDIFLLCLIVHTLNYLVMIQWHIYWVMLIRVKMSEIWDENYTPLPIFCRTAILHSVP